MFFFISIYLRWVLQWVENCNLLIFSSSSCLVLICWRLGFNGMISIAISSWLVLQFQSLIKPKNKGGKRESRKVDHTYQTNRCLGAWNSFFRLVLMFELQIVARDLGKVFWSTENETKQCLVDCKCKTEQWNYETEHRKQPWVWQVCNEQVRGMINVWCNILWRSWIHVERGSKGRMWSIRLPVTTTGERGFMLASRTWLI